jgi:NAD(P)-dependent dehydrogenase (short-subunit alcohol dehydrogenase family)
MVLDPERRLAGMARRTALIVGGNDPADSVAAGLTAADWAVSRVGDDRVEWADDTLAEHFPALTSIDLLVHARYPDIARRHINLMDLSVADWQAAADEPLEAAVRLARGAHLPLAEAGGTIVFLVPLMASAGGAGFTAMATAAEGIRVLAKSLAKTWGVDGIRAHAITLDPSAFLSPADAAGMAEANSLHDMPLGHVPDVESEVVRVVEALTGDDLTALTGASLVVDGGLWMPG